MQDSTVPEVEMRMKSDIKNSWAIIIIQNISWVIKLSNGICKALFCNWFRRCPVVLYFTILFVTMTKLTLQYLRQSKEQQLFNPLCHGPFNWTFGGGGRMMMNP